MTFGVEADTRTSRQVHELVSNNRIADIILWADEDNPTRWDLAELRTGDGEVAVKLRDGDSQFPALLDALSDLTSGHVDKVVVDLLTPRPFTVSVEKVVEETFDDVLAYDVDDAEGQALSGKITPASVTSSDGTAFATEARSLTR